MPPFLSRLFGVRARRSPGVRAVVAFLVLSLATVFGASMVTGRGSDPITAVDPALLTRVVPPSLSASSAGAPRSPNPGVLEPMTDFAAPDLSFEPRPEPELDQPVGVIVRPTPTPRPTPRPQVASGGSPSRTGNSVSGAASWYCLPGVSACHYQYSGGMYAAAGPALRVGSWRGRTVRVCAGGRCVNVKLIDWCQCYGTRVLDLYADAFRQLGSLNSGTLRVTVSW